MDRWRLFLCLFALYFKFQFTGNNAVTYTVTKDNLSFSGQICVNELVEFNLSIHYGWRNIIADKLNRSSVNKVQIMKAYKEFIPADNVKTILNETK